MVKTISKDSKDLAIEFAKYCSKIGVIYETASDKWWYDINNSTYSDKLFNKFLEEKYNEEIQDI